jgi:alkylation response protein AidB-like acyl-CoA dehydrogenase
MSSGASRAASKQEKAKVEFPQEREEKRRALLRAVGDVRGVLAAGADEAERLRTLPPASVAALRDSGLLALKLPAVLGGAEADPMTQLEVIEAVSYIDGSAGWCLFIGAASAGMPGAFLPDAAIAKVFAGGQIPTFAASLTPGATLVAVEGGYRLTGRWSWASGIRHAEWISVRGAVVREGVRSPEFRVCLVPIKDGEIQDNWHVMGLKGTGSCDFAVASVFVPEEFTHDVAAPPLRGGPLYRSGFLGYIAPEAPAFALGVARRALDEILALARSKARGYGRQVALAARGVFQRALGESELRLRAARALMVEVLEKAWAIVCAGRAPEPRMLAELRAAGALATDLALEVTTAAFRYGAGSAVRLNHILQRCLRDLQTASTHLIVSDASYENYGQFMLGLPGADPMA